MLILTIAEGRIAAASERSRVLYRTNATIGRHEINDWVLPDPDRYLSGRHCVVTYRDDEYWITDTSTNGVFVNSSPTPLGRGSSLPLRDGDRFKIGEYEICAKLVPDPEQSARDAAPPELAGRPSQVGPAEDHFAAILAADRRVVNEADPFGLGHGPAPAVPEQASPVPRALQPPHSPPGAAADSPGLPLASLDPVGSPASLDQDPLFAPARSGGNAWSGQQPHSGFGPGPSFVPEPPSFHLPGESPPLSAAEIAADPIGPGLAALQPAADPDHVSPLDQALLPPQPIWNPQPESWHAETGGSAPPVQQTPVAASPPAVPQTPTPKAAAPAEPRAMPPSGADSVAVKAFLEAAGIEIDSLPEAGAIELMRAAGACFREMTEGLRQVLAARSAVKNELRLDRTIVGGVNNNPLKFATGTEEALMAMLRPPARGYMPSTGAVQEVFADIKAHELAMMAGMQRALRALLQRFDPNNLKQRLDQHPTLASILPGARNARYWTAYEQLYQQVASDAEDSFAGVYGREFARAYEEQVKKLS